MLLPGLNEIDWNKKDAELVPKLLRDMCSDDAATRNEAHRSFAREVLHEDGSMEGIHEAGIIADLLKSDAHILIVPFLVEILTTTKIPEKHFVLEFLGTMTRYADFAFLYDDSYLNLKSYAVEIREKVWSYHEIYFQYLRRGSEEERFAALYLICKFSEFQDISLPHLIAIVDNSDSDFQATILSAINMSFFMERPTTDAASQYFIKYAAESYSMHVRIIVVNILAKILRERLPKNLVEFLITAISNYYETKEGYPYIPELRLGEKVRALAFLGQAVGFPAAIKVIDNAVKDEIKFYALAAAMFLTFGLDPSQYDFTIGISSPITRFYVSFGRAYRPHKYHIVEWLPYEVPAIDSKDLSKEQKQVIELICSSAWFWNLDSNMLERFKLPNQRDELIELLKNQENYV